MKDSLKHVFAAAAGIICLIVYILTLNPTVTFMDSGELAAACTTFGIPHPTGYPLFLLLGFLFSNLPFSSAPVYNLNLMSAVLSCAAVIVFYYASIELLGVLFPGRRAPDAKAVHKHKKNKARSSEFDVSFNIIVLTSFFAALVFGFSRTFWSNALSVEVYPLHALLLVIILYFSFKISSNLKGQNRRHWITLFLFLGLGFANHMTTVFVVPGIAYIYYSQYKENRVFAKSVLPLMLWCLPGLLSYLILMFRASSEPFMNWSNPRSFGGLFHHVTGGDYSQLMFSSSSVFSRNAKTFFSTVLGEYAVISGFIALLGFIYTYFRNKNIFNFIIVLIAGCLLYSLNYNIRDLLSYFLLIYILLGLAFGAGLLYILNLLVSKVYAKVNFAVILIIAGLFLSGFSFITNYGLNDGSGNYVAEDLTLNTIIELEPNSILMTYDWGYVYPASVYYQQVQKLRGDVKIFNVKFLSVPWYLNTIKKYYPDVYENCRRDFDEYISTVENGTASPQKLNLLVRNFISKNFAEFPFYMTYDFMYSKEIKPMIANYRSVPDGLVYRLRDTNTEFDSTSGLKSLMFSFREFAPDTKEKERVYISLAGIYYDNAEYHFKNKNLLAALEFADKSISINPNFREAAALRNRILKEIQ